MDEFMSVKEIFQLIMDDFNDKQGFFATN